MKQQNITIIVIPGTIRLQQLALKNPLHSYKPLLLPLFSDGRVPSPGSELSEQLLYDTKYTTNSRSIKKCFLYLTYLSTSWVYPFANHRVLKFGHPICVPFARASVSAVLEFGCNLAFRNFGSYDKRNVQLSYLVSCAIDNNNCSCIFVFVLY